MSKNDKDTTVRVQRLPKVNVLIYGSNERIIPQDYPECSILQEFGFDDKNNKAAWWNEQFLKDRNKYDIFIFLDEGSWFTGPQTVSKVVNKLLKDDVHLAGVYTDIISVATFGETILHINQYLPAFDAQAILEGRYAFNIPLAVKSAAIQWTPFKESMQHLHYLYLLNKLSIRNGLAHMAEPLFTKIATNYDPTEDLKQLND